MSNKGFDFWTVNQVNCLDQNNQLNHINNELIANNKNQTNNPSLYSNGGDSNDSNDEDSRDSLRGSNSEINLNGDGNFCLFYLSIIFIT